MKLKTILHPLVVSIREFKDKSKQRVYCNSEFSQRIEKLKNINQGKRCFIIGNGPSLKIEDLNALVDEDCFACNRIYGLYDKTKWRPKYYCSQDEKVLVQITDDLPFAVQNCEHAFFSYNFRDIYYDKIKEYGNVNLYYKPYVSVYSEDGTYPEGLMPFSKDISKGVYDRLSIAYAMIQIAAYMGYKEIYLIGVDHNYPMKNGVVDASQSYADGIKPIDMSTQFPPELLLCEVSFREAKRFCEKNGISIYNATRGGKLEVFNRISLDEVIGDGSN